MLFKYGLSTPEMRDIHEEQLKIKYRFSRDSVDWSEWRFDVGTQGHDYSTPDKFAHRKLSLVAPVVTSLPNQYAEIKIISYTGNAGDTLFKNPKYSTHRYWRNNNTDVGRTLKKQ